MLVLNNALVAAHEWEKRHEGSYPHLKTGCDVVLINPRHSCKNKADVWRGLQPQALKCRDCPKT